MTSSDIAFELFNRAATGEDDTYPPHIAFVPDDMDGYMELAWRYLAEGRPISIVKGIGMETLIVPCEARSTWRRLLNRIGAFQDVEMFVRRTDRSAPPVRLPRARVDHDAFTALVPTH